MAGVSAVVMVASSLVVGVLGTAAQAADWSPAAVGITKSVEIKGVEYDLPDYPQVEVGEEFVWRIEVTCDYSQTECVNASLSDAIPAEFEIVEESITSSVPADVTVDGQDVTLQFIQELPDTPGQVGLTTVANVSIPVKLRAITQDRDGEQLLNTATAVADNAPEQSDDAGVTAKVDLVLAAEAMKQFDPESMLAVVDAPVSLTIGGANRSNGTVDRLVVQDPVDPTSDPNIFQQYLQLDSLDGATWPVGAETAVVSVFDVANGVWVAADPVASDGALEFPTGVDPGDRGGIRIEFTSTSRSIPIDAETEIELGLTQRASVNDITAPLSLNNVVSAQTGSEGTDSSLAEAPANLELRPANAAVEAGKTFSPDQIAVVGETTTSEVRLDATNSGSMDLSKLTIKEPSNPADLSAANLLAPAFDQGGVTFGSFSDVTWPVGTESVSITYHYASGDSETLSGTDLNAVPAHTLDERVTGFQIDFIGGLIPEGAEAQVSFDVAAPETMADGIWSITGTNEIEVTGETPDDATPNPDPDLAEDDLTVFNDQVSLETKKRLTNDWLWSIPGQSTTAMLETTVLPYPRTTTDPTEIIIDDPSVLNGVTDWYDYLDATAITLTQIPQNATLTVQYRNAAGEFHDIPGMVDIDGAEQGIFSADIPAELHDEIAGIRFIYRSDDGFTQGQTFSSNITYTTRSELRTTGAPIPSQNTDPEDPSPIAEIENCSAAEGSDGDIGSERAVVAECPELELRPVGPGVGPDIQKDWDPVGVFSHSRQNTTVDLDWTLHGIQGLDRVVISDMSSPRGGGAPSAVGAASAYDAFNLTAIEPVANFEFDELVVEIWNAAAGEWQEISQCTGESPCSGATIPRISLTTAEQAVAEGVRFIVTEGDRSGSESPSDPLPGSGVSTVVDSRSFTLNFQLRDTLRSSGDPVVEGPTYNSTEPSTVENTVSLDAFEDDTSAYYDTDGDTIVIIDPELGVSTTKDWAGSPLAIPSDFTGAVPTTRVTIGVTNQTVGTDEIPSFVNELRMIEPGEVDPAAGTMRDPFDEFDLVRFHDIVVPAGTTAISVGFSGPGAPGTVTGATRAEVLDALQALAVADLRNVTEITVVFTGDIPSGDARGGTGRLAFDLELRETKRSGGAVTTGDSPVENTVVGSVTDARWDEEASDFTDETTKQQADASVELQDWNIDVVAGKTFSPTAQTEPDNSPITMTLTGQPVGSERTQELTLTDDRATFWNGYDFVGVKDTFTMPIFAPNANVMNVAFSVCTGRDFDDWAASDPLDPAADCEGTGGEWSSSTGYLTQANARNSDVWLDSLGIAAEDVQGIRASFVREGVVQWENPKSPTVQLPLEIERRADLRSGGPVPSTLPDDGLTAAPGESVKGASTNTVTAGITGVWGGEAEDTEDATVTYRHAKNAVQVQKDPIGMKDPGVPYDYTLTVTNTGNRDIVDPVIVDHLPWEAPLGTLVQFVADSTAADRYTYTLSGADPTVGEPMPTTPDDISVTEVLESDEPTITFEFPAGTRLAPGQTYTIVFPMLFVPGVKSGQPVTNGFDISGDRVWDECTAPSGHTSDLRGDGWECYTEAQVDPKPAAAIQGNKAVRAVGADGTFNDLGFMDDDACTNRVGTSGFAMQPCVPRTAPGQAEDWRLRTVNNGTLPLERMVVADLLPTPGDTTMIAGFERNSEWIPVLTDRTPWLDETSTANLELRTYVTTAAADEICMAGIRNPANLDDCLDPTGSDPTKFVPFDSLADKSLATTLLFVVEPVNADELIEPGARMDIVFETRTGAYSQTTDQSDPTAFNSLTVSALYREGSVTRTLSARDQSNVGIALVTGSVQIEKEVTGDGAAFVPDGQVFTGQLVCTSQGEDVPPRDFTITDGATVTIEHLPVGAECAVTETAASGQTSYTSSTVTVELDPTELPKIELVNVYELTELEISKTVLTDANAYPTGFGFEVVCTFLGDEIELAETDASFTLDHGETHTITGLPVNAECEITETDARGAASTEVAVESLDSDDNPWGDVVEDGDSATITGLAPETGSNSVEFTNSYEVGALTITKEVTGSGADEWGVGPFPVQVVCTFEHAVDNPVFSDDFELTPAAPTITIENLLVGAECEVTETDAGGATSTTIDPAGGLVTIGDDGPEASVVTITNEFQTGDLVILKEVAGPGAPTFSDGPFAFDVACVYLGDEVLAAEVVLEGDGTGDPITSDVIDGLPVGAECTITETASGGADTTPAPVTVTIPAEDPETGPVTVTAGFVNVFSAGTASIEKIVDGDAAGEPWATDVSFTIAAVCEVEIDGIRTTLHSRDYVLHGGEVVSLMNADGSEVELPFGSRCYIDETATGGATDVSINHDSYENGAVIIAAGEVQEIELIATNTFEYGDLDITKTVTGSGSAAGSSRTFEVNVVCVFDQDGQDPIFSLDEEYTIRDGETVTIDHLPRGAECEVTETANGGATVTSLDPVDGAVTVGDTGASAAVVAVTNEFQTGELAVRKEVTGPGAPTFSDGPFSFDVSCVAHGEEVVSEQITLEGDGSGDPLTSDPITLIPVGAECTVTETDNGGADTTPAPVTVTIAEEDSETGPVTVEASLTNSFSAGTATITKVLDGPAAAEPWATDVYFEIAAVCEVDVEGTLELVHEGNYLIRGGETIPLTDTDGAGVLLPLGTHCYLEETGTGGANASTVNFDSYENAAVIEVSDEAQELELFATNTFEYASFDITKTVDGPGAAIGQERDFEVSAVCTLDQGADEPTVVLEQTYPIRHGETVTVDHLPLGAECSVTETETGGADSTTVTVGDSEETGVSGTVSLTGGYAQVAFTNSFEAVPPPAPGPEEPAPGPDGSPAPGPDGLPTTGAEGRWGIGLLGAGVIAAGLALMLIQRRRRRVS